MALLDIRRAGDKVLKERAVPVIRFDRKIKRLMDDMAQTMYNAKGIGLAAPQVGYSLRVIVMDVGEGLIELINPAVIANLGSVLATESCLSVPGLCGVVERFTKVTVAGYNRHGRKTFIFGDGLLATALQHEIDHLEGILFIDRAKTIYKR